MASCDDKTYHLGLEPKYLSVTYANNLTRFDRDTLELSIFPHDQVIDVAGITDKGERKKMSLVGAKPWTYWQDDLPGEDFRYFWLRGTREQNYSVEEQYETSKEFAALVWALEYAGNQSAEGHKVFNYGSAVFRTDMLGNGLMYRQRHWGEYFPMLITENQRQIPLSTQRTDEAARFIADQSGVPTTPNPWNIRSSRMIKYKGRYEWYLALRGRMVRFWAIDNIHPSVEGNTYLFCGNADTLEYEVLVDLPGNGNITDIPLIYQRNPGDSKPSFWYCQSASANGLRAWAVNWNEGNGNYDAPVDVNNTAAAMFTSNGNCSAMAMGPEGDIVAQSHNGNGTNIVYWKYDGSGDRDLPGSYEILPVSDSLGAGLTGIDGTMDTVDMASWSNVDIIPKRTNGYYEILGTVRDNTAEADHLVRIYHNGGVSGTPADWTAELIILDLGTIEHYTHASQHQDGKNVDGSFLTSPVNGRVLKLDWDTYTGTELVPHGYKPSPVKFFNYNFYAPEGRTHFFHRQWDVFPPYTGTPQVL